MKIILTESQYRVLTENTVEINQILDKIGKFGYENLENDEKLTLNQYSEWLKTGKNGEFTPKSVDFESKNNNFKGKIGEEYSTFLPDGSEFSFKYDYSEILNKEKFENDKFHSLENDIFPIINKKDALIYACLFENKFIDIGVPEDYYLAQKILL
jgi:hypothetical protein